MVGGVEVRNRYAGRLAGRRSGYIGSSFRQMR